jgi:tetratricopeptide (TPR) repeat protein
MTKLLARLAQSILVVPLAAGLALAAETGPSVNADAPPVAAEQSRAERLDSLFETLKTETDADAAGEVENAILELWLDSDSDTVNLLMDWTLQAMQRKQYPRALDFLDRIILMEPGYVEGWNKRATVHFLMDDYGKSISDIGKVLEIEPRHFGALSGLGIIFRSLGENEEAKAAFRAALEIDPHLKDVKDELDSLEAETAGRDT